MKARVGRSPLHELADTVQQYALGLPGAREDYPWGELVAKVGRKVFAFFGRRSDLDHKLALSVKLPLSAEGVLALPFAAPTGYGLGKSGWVSITCTLDDPLPAELLQSWIEESYRAIAPAKLSSLLPGPS